MKTSEDIGEQLYRLLDFHHWVQSNVLWPLVPDSLVDPLKASLRGIEHRLLAELFDRGEVERAAAIQKAMTHPRRMPV